MPRKPDNTVLERLREGPLPSRLAHTVAADINSLKVTIHKLRELGFVITTEPDPEDVDHPGRRQKVQYVLAYDPTTKGNTNATD